MTIGSIAASLGLALGLAAVFVRLRDRFLIPRSGPTDAHAAGYERYVSLANVVPQLIWTTDTEGTVEFVNDRWIAYTGFDLERTRAGGWRDALHPDQAPSIRDAWNHALRTGDTFAAEFRIREALTGRYRWFLVNAVPVRGRNGAVASWIGTCTDVDAQKRLEERDAFLARAGERLAASLDVGAVLGAIKSIVIPRLGDGAWVALLAEDGRYVLAGIGSANLATEVETRRWVGEPLQGALQSAVEAVVGSRDLLVLERPGAFSDPWMRDVAPGAAMLVPLLSGETAVGVLALVRETGRSYDPDDVGIVREFARRAALSLDHARRYQRERSTADALQRAMLPSQLPQIPGVKFSASYSAASESQRVGGDFYDAFALPDGRVAVTIGDVTGHGLEAAVIMGEIRQSLRAASMESTEPHAILDRASRLLVANGRTVFVTAIVGVLDMATGWFTYATAGHPAPLLDDGLRIRRLPGGGLPIGLRDDEGVDIALRLHAPCTLVLYTDGLLEFSRDLADAERRIETAIRALVTTDCEHLANAVMKDVLGDDQANDDIAILTVSVDRFAFEEPGEVREWRFFSTDSRAAAAARREIGELAAEWTGDDAVRFNAELAFGELASNATRHAPGAMRVTFAGGNGARPTLAVEDSGAGFVPRDAAVDDYAESGRGISLVRAIAGDVHFERAERGGTRAVVAL